MHRETLQELFTRLIWWVMFIGVGVAGLVYGLFELPQVSLVETGFIRVLAVFGYVFLLRLLLWPKPLLGAGLILLSINASVQLLVGNGVFNTTFAMLSIATLPTLFLSILWGWRGAALGLLVLFPVLFHKTNVNIEATVIGWVIITATAFSGGLIHQLIGNIDQANIKLEQMATTDPLTKLGNRFALETSFKSLEGVGILCMWDVNGLKRVNDEKGHHAGDAYLLAFVSAYQKQSSDTLYRVGGDEFVSFHPTDTDPTDLYARVKQKFSDVSAGWADIEGRNLDAVLRQADRAMYLEKGKRIASTSVG